MNLCDKVFRQIGNPLEWSSAKKANLLLWIYLVQQSIYQVWIEMAMRLPEFAGMIDLQQVAHHRVYFNSLLMLSAGLILLTRLAQTRNRQSVFYEYLATLYFGVSHVYYAYCVGLMSLPVGVVLAGAPVVGFIFFDRLAVASAFVISLVLVIGLSLASFMDVLPYAPLAQNLYQGDGRLSMGWQLTYMVFASPHLVFIFALAYYVLQRWRIREQEAMHLSRTDSLTGLVNRRHILSLLEQEKVACEKREMPLCLVMVDLDHFKSINDRWGHDVGDQVLIMAALALKNTVRQLDHVGRYGGEEFLVILPGLEAEQARCLAERIRTTIAALVLELPDGESLSLSASLGMSCYTVSQIVTVDDLVKQADVALYKAKGTGRDRLVVAP
ncbi:MAG: GGDEF domain-containing protein [Ketobacter sp.]|nr:GGDEF domain-containing protein [Ketobacter sp.]